MREDWGEGDSSLKLPPNRGEYANRLTSRVINLTRSDLELRRWLRPPHWPRP